MGITLFNQSQNLPFSKTTRVSEQFDKNNTTLENITDLSVNVIAGRSYEFEAKLFYTCDATGGTKYDISGTATATSIIAELIEYDDTANNTPIVFRLTSLGGSVGGSTTKTNGYCEIKGVITVNAGGALTIRFAQNAANNESSILLGSTFKVTEIL